MMRPFSLFAAAMFLVAATPSQSEAQASPVPRDTSLAEMASTLRAGDEAVRRIVERAMAAVELAEARANQQVASAQVRIADLERALAAQGAELEALKESEGELGTALDASLAEADRYARTASTLKEERDLALAQLEAARMELAELAGWRDTATRASAQARRAIAEREELSERLAALHTQYGFSEHALAEARVQAEVAGRTFADSLAWHAREQDALRATIAQFQDRIAAYQHRSGVVEESLRVETARSASWETEIVRLRRELSEAGRMATAERALAEAERGRLAEELAAERVAGAGLRQTVAAERERAAGLEQRLAAVTESERVARAALANREASSETMARVMAERDALRLELQNTVQILDDAAAALMTARAERDEARRGAGGGSAGALAALEARLAARDREIEALRSALTSTAAVPPTPAQPVPVTGNAGTAIAPVAPVSPTVSDPAVVNPVVSVPATAPVATAPPAYVFDPQRGSYDELAQIPAVGPTRARAIVWYRENVGAIQGENDLKSVPGFNDDRIRLLRPYWRTKED